jgi:RIO-like serine/threonine protein kinase
VPRTFEKKYADRTLFDEALASSEEAASIASRSRFLRAPGVIEADRERLAIRFEYMEGWRVLTALLRSRAFLGLRAAELEGLFRNIGGALAEYHAGSSKIHGDFDSTNILFKPGEPRICLIDFSRPNFADRPDYCRGSIYRDLALFLIHLRVKYPPHQLHLAYRPENRLLSRSFLEGYFDLSSQRYSFDELRTEFDACMEIPYLSRTFINRFLGWSKPFDLEDLR